jgi:hypothetical protein
MNKPIKTNFNVSISKCGLRNINFKQRFHEPSFFNNICKTAYETASDSSSGEH